MKIKRSSVAYYVMILLLYDAAFMRIPYFSYTNKIKYLCIVLLGAMLFVKIKKNIVSKYKNAYLALYVFFVLVSSLINRNTNIITHSLIAGFSYILIIVEAFVLFIYIQQKKGLDYLLKAIFNITLFHVIVNDFLMTISPDLFVTSSVFYFLGNKFAVSYRHIELIMLYWLSSSKNKLSVIEKAEVVILYLVAVHAILKVGCLTGILMIIILSLLSSPLRKIMDKPSSVLLLICISGGFVFVYDFFLSKTFIQTFITSILGKDMSLNGRITIYSFIPKVLSKNLLWGYGYGSSYEVWMNATNVFPNSQNGIIDCIVEQGLISTISLVLFIVSVVFEFRSLKERKAYPLLAMIITYIIISSIEICLSVNFVIWVVLLFICIRNERILERGESYEMCVNTSIFW